MKTAEKAGWKNSGDSNDEEPTKKSMNRVVTWVIEAIHASISSDNITKNAIRVQIKIAQCVERALAAEVMSIVAYEKERKNKRSYEFTFTDKDMKR